MEEKQTEKPKLPGAFSLFRPSFDALMVNVWTFLGLLLIPLAGLTLASSLAAAGERGEAISTLVVLIGLASFIFFLFVAPALPSLVLKSVQGHEVPIGDALKVGLKYFWRFYGLSLLVGVIILVGFILLIAPGIFMMKRYFLVQFYLYDQNLGILEAMRKCAVDAKEFSGAIWGMLGVVFLIQLPGIIPLFGVVSFALAIIYYCAPGVRYFQIKSAAGKVS